MREATPHDIRRQVLNTPTYGIRSELRCLRVYAHVCVCLDRNRPYFSDILRQIPQMPSEPDAGPGPGSSAPGPSIGKTLFTREVARMCAIEAACGVAAAAIVSPFISIVDKAIFSNASGKATIMATITESLRTLIRRPAQFFRDKSFRWIWVVYGGTYILANITDRLNIVRKSTLAQATTAKFIAASTANVSLSVIKDRAFSRMYGVSAPRPLPPTAAVCYAVRDMITVGASFTAVDPLGNMLGSHFAMSSESAQVSAQLLAPVAAQVLNTPIFLLGMDLYNRPVTSAGDRVAFISKQYAKTLFSRWARIFPAFSIGGVVNRKLRLYSVAQPSAESGQ